MKDITKTFISNLSKFAYTKQITITELCEIADIPIPSFYRWKAGRSNMQLNTAQEIVSKLNTYFNPDGDKEKDYQLGWFLLDPIQDIVG